MIPPPFSLRFFSSFSYVICLCWTSRFSYWSQIFRIFDPLISFGYSPFWFVSNWWVPFVLHKNCSFINRIPLNRTWLDGWFKSAMAELQKFSLLASFRMRWFFDSWSYNALVSLSFVCLNLISEFRIRKTASRLLGTPVHSYLFVSSIMFYMELRSLLWPDRAYHCFDSLIGFCLLE